MRERNLLISRSLVGDVFILSFRNGECGIDEC